MGFVRALWARSKGDAVGLPEADQGRLLLWFHPPLQLVPNSALSSGNNREGDVTIRTELLDGVDLYEVGPGS
jgi:hypothetical protein